MLKTNTIAPKVIKVSAKLKAGQWMLFKCKSISDITSDVLRALDEIHEAKIEMIERHVPKALRNAFLDFAGAKGSKIYNAFKNRDAVYLAKVFQK